MVGKITTPVGAAVFTKLVEPDTKFDSVGVYTASIKLTADAAEEFKLALAPSLKKAVQQLNSEGANVTASTLKLPIKKDDDGNFIVTAKIKAAAVNSKTGEKFTNTVTVVDKDGDVVKDVPMIGKGSKLKLSADVIPYHFKAKELVGVSLRLRQVQIVELKEVVAKTNKSIPF